METDGQVDRQTDGPREGKTGSNLRDKVQLKKVKLLFHTLSRTCLSFHFSLCVDRCKETIAKLAEDADQRFSVAYLS